MNSTTAPDSAVIGLDVGGTKIAAGLVVPAAEPRLLFRNERPTLGDRGGEAIFAAALDAARELAAEAPNHAVRVKAVGVALCEIVDSSGAIRSSNAVAWENLRVTDRLHRIAPTVIEADVRAAALAEARYGAGRGFRIFVYVTVGTGVSSCLVVDGQPYSGARGATGTFASSPLPVALDEVRALQAPTIEELGSGPGLVARFVESGGVASSAQEVLAAATSGDLGAVSVARQGAQAVGAGIGWLVNVLDPEAVILGGGLGLVEGLYRDALVTSLRHHVWWSGHRNLPVLSALTGRNAGILGAAAVAWDHFAPAGRPAATSVREAFTR